MAPTHKRASAPEASRSRRNRRRGGVAAASVVLAVIGGIAVANVTNAGDLLAHSRRTDFVRQFPIESLDGRGNNVDNPRGASPTGRTPGSAPAHYADGIGAPVTGPNARAASNRIIRTTAPERVLRAPGHPVGLDLGPVPGPHVRPAPGRRADGDRVQHPVQRQRPAGGRSPTTSASSRSTGRPQSAGTGTSHGQPAPADQHAAVLHRRQPGLRRDQRAAGLAARRFAGRQPGQQPGHADAAQRLPAAQDRPRQRRPRRPAMAIDGRLLANPNNAAVAGDARANENIALTATHTLFAREHNRIVGLLPNSLSQEDKFQIARRVVIAEEQYITYQELLPAMGVALPQYTGYKTNVNTTLSQRVRHRGLPGAQPDPRRVRGRGRRSATTPRPQLDVVRGAGHRGHRRRRRGRARGPARTSRSSTRTCSQQIGARPDAAGARRRVAVQQRREHRQRAAQRAVPDPPSNGNPNAWIEADVPSASPASTTWARSTSQRARDHGIGTYNQLRQAYGLPAKTSFTAITGESTDQFPAGVTSRQPDSLTTSRRCSTSTASRSTSMTRPPSRPPAPATSGAAPWPRGCGASTATSTTSTPSPA